MAHKVTIYTHAGPGPNPLKILILLEALGIEYKNIAKEFGDGPKGVKSPEFLKINPNGRLPTLIDHTNDDLVVWESGAILLYLTERFDLDHHYNGATPKERTEVLEWLIYQVSTLGPYQGQAHWFMNLHPVKEPELHSSVLKRYQDETRRIYAVLEKRLAENGKWLVLDRPTIADIAHFSWVNIAFTVGVELNDFPNLAEWVKRINDKPPVKAAFAKVKKEAD